MFQKALRYSFLLLVRGHFVLQKPDNFESNYDITNVRNYYTLLKQRLEKDTKPRFLYFLSDLQSCTSATADERWRQYVQYSTGWSDHK